jgi:hypothetical protein
MSINRRASLASVLPQALNNGPLPPKVPAPKLRTGTFNPDAPKFLYSMLAVSWYWMKYGGNQIVVPSEQHLCPELTTAEAWVNPPSRLEFN